MVSSNVKMSFIFSLGNLRDLSLSPISVWLFLTCIPGINLTSVALALQLMAPFIWVLTVHS